MSAVQAILDFDWKIRAVCITVNALLKHNTNTTNRRGAWEQMLLFWLHVSLGDSSLPLHRILRLHSREWHFYSFHKSLQLYANRVFRNESCYNCNSKSVEKTKLHPLMFYSFQSWPKSLCSAAWKCPFPQQNQIGAGVTGLTYPE